MSSQEQGSPLNTPETGDIVSQSSSLEQASARETLAQADNESLVDQGVLQQEAEGDSSPAGGRVIRRAQRAKGFIERGQKSWSKKETIRHFVSLAGQLVHSPQSNLHENKHDFAQMKAEFQTLMAGHR